MTDERDEQLEEANESAQPPELAPATGEPPSPEEQIRKLEEANQQLAEEKKKLFDQLLRRQADFENYRKRSEREQKEYRYTVQADLVDALLPVLDGFERALAAPAEGAGEEYRKGVELIYKQLYDSLARMGLEAVESVGRTFDPFLHHAVERVETTDHADQEIVEELQRGYMFKQKLLRPALVRVAVHPSAPEPQPED